MAISRTSDNASDFMSGAERAHTHEVARSALLGAAIVWSWIFVLGAISGAPLRLATMLGRGITHFVGVQSTVPAWIAVIVFTIVHVAIWFGLAKISVLVLHAAVHTPAVLMLAAVISILLLLALAGITTIFESDGLGAAFAWPSIFAGSIIGLSAMWWYLVRRHPEVRAELAHIDDDS